MNERSENVVLTTDPNNKWSREEAFEVCRIIEGIAPLYGAHVALTGGLLYKDGPRKDCDVLLYRIRERNLPVDFDGLMTDLAMHGFEIGKDYGWCKKLQYKGKPTDMFDPEASGEYPERAEADPDAAMEALRDDRELFA